MWYFFMMFSRTCFGRFRSVENGPPGATRMMKKLRLMMMNSVGMSPRMRRMMYFVMSVPEKTGAGSAPAPARASSARYFL